MEREERKKVRELLVGVAARRQRMARAPRPTAPKAAARPNGFVASCLREGSLRRFLVTSEERVARIRAIAPGPSHVSI
jgi:hypothetical protein